MRCVMQAQLVAESLLEGLSEKDGTKPARTVLVIASPANVRAMFKHAQQIGLLEQCVWIITELWEEWINKVDDMGTEYLGALFLRPVATNQADEMYAYLQSQTAVDVSAHALGGSCCIGDRI